MARSHRVAIVRAALIVVAVLCLAAAFGGIWLARAGVVVAVLAGVAGAWFAVGLLSEQRRRSTHDLRELRRDHRAAFTAERLHNSGVVDELATRVDNSQRLADSRAVKITELGVAVRALESEKTTLAETVATRDETVEGLTADLAERRLEVTDLGRQVETLGSSITALEATITTLSATVVAYEELLTEAGASTDSSQLGSADIHELPRHRAAEAS